MQLKFDPDISYECVQCGRGCFNSWDIGVEPAVVERLAGHFLELPVVQERGSAFLDDAAGGFKINKDEAHPECGFLLPDRLCSIHAELGFEAKPLTCQQYPYQMVQTPDGRTWVSAAYSCTAVREDIGPPLSESRATIEQLLARGGRVQRLRADRIELLDPYVSDWPQVEEYDAELSVRSHGVAAEVAMEAAVAQLAQALATLPSAEPGEDVAVPYGLLRQAWRVQPDTSTLRALRSLLLMGLLKPCLSLRASESWASIDRAMLEGSDLQLPEFGWEGPLADLDLWVNGGVFGRFEGEIERYSRSLRFRKSHLTMGGLLPGLMLLWMLPGVIRLLTGLFAWKQQREPVLEDFRAALERAETRLVAHTFDTVPIFQNFARHCVAVARASS